MTLSASILDCVEIKGFCVCSHPRRQARSLGDLEECRRPNWHRLDHRHHWHVNRLEIPLHRLLLTLGEEHEALHLLSSDYCHLWRSKVRHYTLYHWFLRITCSPRMLDMQACCVIAKLIEATVHWASRHKSWNGQWCPDYNSIHGPLR